MRFMIRYTIRCAVLLLNTSRCHIYHRPLKASSIRFTLTDAFSQPLPLTNMIRITFVVGAGKLSRQKYDEKAMLAVTSTLKELKYIEDRGASCVNECAGCYKTQHDTGKSLFTVLVFPRLAIGRTTHTISNKQGEEEYEPLIPMNSPGYKMATCKLSTFHNLLTTYCHTYSEKKECLHCLEGLLQVEKAIEGKMMVGQPLDAAEQAFYNESCELKEKYVYTQQESNKHIDEGKVTNHERRILIEMNETRIAMLMSEKRATSVAEKLKKALIRKTQLQERLRDEVLAMHSSSYPPPLRYESKISTLRKKLQPILALEESSRGRFLTLEETRALSTKEELLIEINDLEEGSRGWFEDDDAFQERLEKSRSRAQQTKGKSMMRATASNKEGGSGSSIVNKWILPGEKPKSQWGSGKSKVKGKGGAVFTAMMLDSSSDEEEDDNLDLKRDDDPLKKKEHIAASNILVSKTLAAESSEAMTDKLVPQAAKKKKKKKSKAKTADHEPATVEEMVVTTDVRTEDSGVPLSVSSSLLEFWRILLLPVCMAIITILLSPVMSMFNGRGKGDKTTKKKQR